ncbi:MAG: hypothetical protein RJA86_970, partial [Pseudomonadota bacterium]
RGKSMSQYHQDFYAWTQEQAQLLKVGQLSAIDIENIIEEIESMGRSEKRELSSRLTVLLMHLLKWHYQEAYRSHSWVLTINEQRDELKELIHDNPSLKPWLDDVIKESYEKAKVKAERETGISKKVFIEACPWTLVQIFDEAFLPE